MTPWLAPLIAGLLGTLAMSALLLLPPKLGLPRVDVVRAVGAFITKDREKAFAPGLVLHFAAGIVFAYAYYFIFAWIGAIPLNALTGLFAGAIHGVLVMLLVAITILEHHPLAWYHERGPMTGVSQLLGHMVYGLVVGATCHALIAGQVHL